MNITDKEFDAIKTRIQNDPTAVKTNWYDGHKWEDNSGNWYGWESCGYIEYIFYAGTQYKRQAGTIEEVHPYVQNGQVVSYRVCDWFCIKCSECPFGCLENGDACPTYPTKDLARLDMENIAKRAAEVSKKIQEGA